MYLATTLTTPERQAAYGVKSTNNRLVFVNSGMKIGQARNVLLLKFGRRWSQNPQISGGYNLDDDDIEPADRGEIQGRHAEAEGAQYSFIRRVTLECRCGRRFESFPRQGLSSPWDYWENTILWRGYPIHFYPDINKEDRGEDTNMLRELVTSRPDLKFAVLDRPDLYIYRYHGGNVWDASHWNRMFALSGVHHMPGECKDERQTR
jgi:hypothetical protein